MSLNGTFPARVLPTAVLPGTSEASNPQETVTVLPMTAAVASDDKKYPGQYPYRYSEGNTARFVNDTSDPAPMIIKIFGACSNPSVYVGENEYSVNTDISLGEYVIIDQRDKSIYRVSQSGTRTSIFHLRKKSVDTTRCLTQPSFFPMPPVHLPPSS